MCCVDKMVREVRARQEIVGSNSSYTVLIFLFDESLRHRLFYPMPKAQTFGLGYGVPVPKGFNNRYNKPIFQ